MSAPQLRFKEFDGKWEKKVLTEVTNYTKGFAFKSENYQADGIRIVRVSDLTATSIKQDNQMVFVESHEIANFEAYKLLQGDIVITTVGSKPELVDSAVGRGILIRKKNEGLLNQNMLKLNSTDGIENTFLFGQLNTKRYVTHIKNIQRGNANQSNITVKDLFQFEVYIPELIEQTKIANFLTAIDEKITQLTQKCDLLAQYKKGVMQQIFSQKLRFKDDDGREFPEWEELRLGSIAELTSSKRVYLSDYVDKGVPFYRGKEISELKRNIIPTEILYISRDAYENFKLNYGIPRINDILITAVGTLGNVYRIKDNSEFYFKDGNLIWLRNINISGSFLEILLENNIKKIQKSSIGSTQRALTIIELKKLKFSIPVLPEQTKIANFLTAIDDKITHTQIQLKAVKQYKKGLLQQMFV